MTDFIYYNPIIATHASNHDLPGIGKFASYFKIYNPGVVPVDRTGTITFPVRTTSLFPLPHARAMHASYEDICNARAKELLARAAKLQCKIYVFWSGGIDSTLVLVSLLKNSTSAERANIVVLMSEDSIRENPNFYREHVHGKLERESASRFPYLFGGDHLIVNGEHNDQIFGSDIVASIINRFGAAVIHAPYDGAMIRTFYTERIGDESTAEFFASLFERLSAVASVPIVTNYDFFWWINFAVKWQAVYTRMLSYVSARNAPKITKAYLDTYYAPFYNTEDFQLWSMQNPDKKIKDTWKSYKWLCKEIIYDYTKDADYRDNKLKQGSLSNIILQQLPFNFIDSSMQFSFEADRSEYYRSDNDFI